MMRSANILFEKVNIFTAIFNSELTKIEYYETRIVFDRLECSSLEFPSIPVVESIWTNKNKSISFIYRAYENYVTDFEIYNDVNKKRLSINDLKANLNINNIEIHLMPGNINQKYEEYLNATLDFIKSSDLWQVLTNEKWLDIPFNWQNQK